MKDGKNCDLGSLVITETRYRGVLHGTVLLSSHRLFKVTAEDLCNNTTFGAD